jgi:hypothetical protein
MMEDETFEAGNVRSVCCIAGRSRSTVKDGLIDQAWRA